MMSSTKLDVVWSPVHHKKFIVWGSDITLYEVARLQEIDKTTTFTQISPTRGATVLASQSACGARCVDVAAVAVAEHPAPLLALGHATGRVALTTLRQTHDPLGLSGREFVPRHPRLCNSVSWSHAEPSLLACALEKHRSDHSILLWDVNRIPGPAEDHPGSSGPTAAAAASHRPLGEMGLSETAHSVSWARAAPRTLIASMNLKFIKIFDLRDLSNKAVSAATTRACYGACADPFNAWQLASRGENLICVWDARAFDRPLLTLPQPRPVARVQWCPTRRNLLVSLQRDSSTLRLHEIQQAGAGAEWAAHNLDAATAGPAAAVEAEGEEGSRARAPGVVEREVGPGAAPPAAPLAACCWHPAHEASLLAVTHTGSIVEYTVSERATVSWGAGGLAWTAGGARGELRLMPEEFYAAIRDVSYVMRRRAHTDYGLKPDLWQNADLADDEALSGLWHFLALSKSLVEDGCIRNNPWKHPGVRSVIRPPGEGYRSEIVPSLIPDLPNRRVTLYRSQERTRALQLCGWGWGWENAGAGVERLEAEGTPCRAAALAAFHLRLRTALDILARAREPQLRVVALAMAGLSEERLWREALCAAAPALPDAYLRALLRFLAASASTPPAAAQPHAHAQPDLTPVLNETEMRLEDRVAFACIFLSDAKLHEYVQQTCDALLDQGDLSGLLLTGASPEGVCLLQRWVEHTGDVQSAALVAARCFTPDLLRDPRVLYWLDSYRTILDSWQMWWSRCALDTWVRSGEAAGGGAGGGAGGAERRVGVVCTYCGKCVAAPPGPARPRPAFVRLPPPAAKMKQISSCPNCRKPLPRCGVCLLHLGTDAGGASAGTGAGAGGAAYGGWFSWCVACRHGGHAQHMLDWFREHTECPVSSCSCRCDVLDPPPPPPAPTPAPLRS